MTGVKVRATYRLQLNRGFTFADAERLVPYLDALGISHLYASPVTVAQPGSAHGYDVIDPTRINPELGGEEGLRSLAAALRARGMGLIVDIVPNHMSVAGGANRWWNDVLAKGPASPYARFFDIDWRGKILLPFLAEPLDEALAKGALKLERDADGRLWIVAYGHDRYPVRDEDQSTPLPLAERAPSDSPLPLAGRAPSDSPLPLAGGAPSNSPLPLAGGAGGGVKGDRLEADLADLLDHQHYRLAWWRRAGEALNWRRFFTITGLAGVRVEDEAVFEATHALYFRLHDEGLIDGVRVDHVDGLADPAGYCRRLRARMPDAYIVVEKILAAGEKLAEDWGVDGTSGYDFMEQVSLLLHDPAGEAPLGAYWARLSGRSADFAGEALQARREILAAEFPGQLRACAAAFAALSGTPEGTTGSIESALEHLLCAFPTYRTYGAPADAAALAAARAGAVSLAPAEAETIDRLLACLAGKSDDAGEAARRFRQLSSPLAAKAVEDTALYRYGRLLSRNDVGFAPSRFSMAAADFHAAMRDRAARWPRAMLATATHDHKRGEDVRARLAVLSELPEMWIETVGRWRRMNRAAAAGIDRGDAYQFYQMLVGAWPPALSIEDADGWRDFRARLAGWLEKAVREARLRSSWSDPDERYERHCRAFLETVLDPSRSAEFLSDARRFVHRLVPAGDANALVQTFLRCTAPGVPDCYQGCEFADLSLVDPDNRRPVDFAARIASLDQEAQDFDSTKQHLIARVLRLRREHPRLWCEGSWEPVEVEGLRSGHILAFTRRDGDSVLLGAAQLHCARALVEAERWVPRREWWGDTRLLSGEPALAADLLGRMPVHLSVRERWSG